MSDKIEALRELAGKATPGPWHAVQDSVIGSGGNYNLQIADAYNWHMTDGVVEANAAYIAAASPDVILSLLSELDRLRSSNEAMRKALEPFRECVVMTERNRVIVGFETDKIAAQVADALADYVEGSQS